MRNIIIVFLVLLALNVQAQKHTFRNNTSEYKNVNTGLTLKSDDTDDITIECLGNGHYKLIDSKGSMTMKYNHSEKFTEGTMYFYDIVGKQHAKVKSGKKMSDLANGVPGKFAIDTDDLSIVFIIRLNN